MKIIDSHCDALLKLWEDPDNRSFAKDDSIQVNFERMVEGDVIVQCFALFAEPFLKNDEKYRAILKQVELYYSQVISQKQMKSIKNWDDLFHLEANERGAILTLEGMDAIGDDLDRLKLLFELGVKSVGLTWNHANLCGDGVLEDRGAGLSLFGKEVIKLNNESEVLTDVSHLNERGFWDCIELSNYVWASHSNAKTIANHPRNLTDEQILAIIKKGGMIGVVFYPLFLTNSDSAQIDDIIRHIEHICALGGEEHLCFGSDFDGIPITVNGFEHAGKYQAFLEELLKHYDEKYVIGFAHQNFLARVKQYFLK